MCNSQTPPPLCSLAYLWMSRRLQDYRSSVVHRCLNFPSRSTMRPQLHLSYQHHRPSPSANLPQRPTHIPLLSRSMPVRRALRLVLTQWHQLRNRSHKPTSRKGSRLNHNRHACSQRTRFESLRTCNIPLTVAIHPRLVSSLSDPCSKWLALFVFSSCYCVCFRFCSSSPPSDACARCGRLPRRTMETSCPWRRYVSFRSFS